MISSLIVVISNSLMAISCPIGVDGYMSHFYICLILGYGDIGWKYMAILNGICKHNRITQLILELMDENISISISIYINMGPFRCLIVDMSN